MLDNLRYTQPSRVEIDLAPALNALYSLTTVLEAEESPGISAWSVQTREALSTEEWEQHHIMAKWIGAEALANVVPQKTAHGSFLAYLEALQAIDATPLRDDLLTWAVASPGHRLYYKPMRAIEDPLSLLASWEAFSAFHNCEELEVTEQKAVHQAFEYFLDPPALKGLITRYLAHFWHTYLEAEWARTLPQLEMTITRFRQIDVSGMSHFEVIEAITRRNLRGVYRPDVLQSYATLRFIPSPHSGPYIMKTCRGQALNISFGAHRFSTRTRDADTLDSAYVVEQMKALADETRLEIIRMLKAEGELGTAEIIARLELSKSTASRHLRQLYATGIVDTRTDEDGLSKYYRLNPDAAERMQVLLGSLLG